MYKDLQCLLYYIAKGPRRRARIYFDVLCIVYKKKFVCFINKLYLKVWRFILAFWIVLCLSWGYLQFKHDYSLIHNYANLDAPFSDYYTKWRTDGSPGQDPPK